MRINNLLACAGLIACALIPSAVANHKRLLADRELKARRLDKEISDLLEPADAMLAIARNDKAVWRNLKRKGLDELIRLRDLGFLCKRMAMPDRAHAYAVRASAQVQHLLAVM